jgi:hypothetical protein
MELSNRNTLEQQFAGALAELTQNQRTRLRELMGTPPDPRRVPESFWQEIRDDVQRRIAAIAYLLFIAAAEEHSQEYGTRTTSTAFDVDATAFAQQQAQVMANGYVNASRDRFNSFVNAANQQQSAGGVLPADATKAGTAIAEPVDAPSIPDSRFKFDDEQALADEIADVLRNESAERISTTVTTDAQTKGGNAGVKAAWNDPHSTIHGMLLTKIWTNHPELTRTGPCERCEALNGHAEDEWGSIDASASSGPPLHDFCACTTNYIFTPQMKEN